MRNKHLNKVHWMGVFTVENRKINKILRAWNNVVLNLNIFRVPMVALASKIQKDLSWALSSQKIPHPHFMKREPFC